MKTRVTSYPTDIQLDLGTRIAAKTGHYSNAGLDMGQYDRTITSHYFVHVVDGKLFLRVEWFEVGANGTHNGDYQFGFGPVSVSAVKALEIAVRESAQVGPTQGVRIRRGWIKSKTHGCGQLADIVKQGIPA